MLPNPEFRKVAPPPVVGERGGGVWGFDNCLMAISMLVYCAGECGANPAILGGVVLLLASEKSKKQRLGARANRKKPSSPCFWSPE